MAIDLALPGRNAEVNPTSAPYALDKYQPEPKEKREGFALCLSGGGFRATLFHLGALRRLNELDLLRQITTVSSVSGGSITAAHLAIALNWPVTGPVPDWETRLVKPLRQFTTQNIRTPAILQRWLPWNWFKSSTGVEALARAYKKAISINLADLPAMPRFILCATDMVFGVNWIFEKDQMGDYQVGYADPLDWPLAKAVAASSCFPPVFNPLPIREKLNEYKGGKFPGGSKRDKCLSDLRLTDGGNYDNFGLEPVWKDHAFVLVSDGGGTFNFEADKNLIWRINRYVSIIDNQVRALRKRWLISSFIKDVLDGAYWGVSSATTSYDPASTAGYSKDLAQEVISQIRTDLDAFSDAEAAVLENHGYLLADAAIKKHLPHLIPSNAPPITIPHPEWMDEKKVRISLALSNKVKILGRWR